MINTETRTLLETNMHMEATYIDAVVESAFIPDENAAHGHRRYEYH